jgi:hypothetical protein
MLSREGSAVWEVECGYFWEKLVGV